MKTQPRLSELDATKLANIQLRRQLFVNEVEQFQREIFAAYGNEGETLAIQPDGTIVRTPKEAPPTPKAKRAR